MKKWVGQIGVMPFVIFVMLLFLTIMLFAFPPITKEDRIPKKVSYNQFVKMVDKNNVKNVSIRLEAPTFKFVDKKDKRYESDNPKTVAFKEYLLKHDIKVNEIMTQKSNPNFLVSFMIGGFILMVIAYFLIGRGLSSAKERYVANGTKEKTKEIQVIPGIRFGDIAGNEAVKRDVKFLIEFLKSPDKYKKMGARMPKGTIFYGPPGTGKTLIAKAIAGEAGVPFFSVSGSDFTEMYVGVGAKRVRSLFEDARKKSPCIIFIDEIDAIGRKRGMDNSGERDNTINALLTELDGFTSSDGIIVIGATNRLEVLDDALVRPGRFDKHIAIPLPDKKERLELLNLYAKNKSLSNDVNLNELATITIGFSGAGIETLMNESAIIAVNKGKEMIDDTDMDDAFYKVIMKGDKKDIKESNQEQLKLVAWHEAGHAMVAKLLTKKSVPKVTIVPSTNGAGGVTFIIPEKAGLHTRKDLISEVQTLYAGRIAEHLLTGDEELITTGASQDIKQATNVLLAMIKEFGMSKEFGMLYMEAVKSSDSSKEVLDEAKQLSKDIYYKTFELMTEKKGLLKAIAESLLLNETIQEEELDNIIKAYAV